MSKHTFSYEVTQDGRVLSVDSNWRGYGMRELSQTINSDGYPSVRMMTNGKRKRYTVHGLVARTHISPQPLPGYEVRHLDGNKLNNHCKNLAWGTQKDNADDRELHGKTSRGPAHSSVIRAKKKDSYSDADTLSIKMLSVKGWTQRAIANHIGRSQSGVGQVIRRSK